MFSLQFIVVLLACPVVAFLCYGAYRFRQEETHENATSRKMPTEKSDVRTGKANA